MHLTDTEVQPLLCLPACSLWDLFALSKDQIKLPLTSLGLSLAFVAFRPTFKELELDILNSCAWVLSIRLL